MLGMINAAVWDLGNGFRGVASAEPAVGRQMEG